MNFIEIFNSKSNKQISLNVNFSSFLKHVQMDLIIR